MIKNKKSKIKNQKLAVGVDSGDAEIEYAGRRITMSLKKQPLLRGVERIVRDPRHIKDIEVHLRNVTFSTTRQIVATVNTLAWQLGIKVNGKGQLKAAYGGEPNITV